MKKLLLVFLACTSLNAAWAQQNFWSSRAAKGNIVTDKAVARQSFPTEFKLFNLNTDGLRQQLMAAVNSNAAKHSIVITLPDAEGNIESFEMFEASNFEPGLQAKFPQIRAFSGRGLTDKYATVKLSLSPQGVQGMVFRTGKDNEFIEAYSKDHTVYAVFRSQRKAGQLPWSCSTDDKDAYASMRSQATAASSLTGSSTGQLKTMRLAQSCNGEYANYFGATSAADVDKVLAAFNATLTRCNGVYEKDLALHLNLIAASTAVIYYSPSTDPYTTLSNWNQQLQTALTNNVGSANYDIGHMFGASGGGGNAGCIGCVCVNPTSGTPLGKGAGITSPADGIPQGDNFDIDYVVHEVGHQLGANHTFSYSLEGSGQNKEIGSGITIMGYAGITSYDVAGHSIAAYHETSIAQIQANLASKTCPVSTNITGVNATPVVAAVPNYTIPISTPFALTASATDANGDALTYSWEENDNSTVSGANSKAGVTKTTGPNWLSFAPTASPTRTFPTLATILAGAVTTGPLAGGDAGVNIEALSSVARTLNFRVTVRDNAPYSTSPLEVGQTAFTDMVVTVSAASGPFAVTAPNTAVTYGGGSTQNITWSVASTTASPVSCANVKISLSTDGGLSFPTVLAASTANDGSEALIIPNVATTTARIKVEAVGNIFFDISNANFTITATAGCATPTGLAASNITTRSATVSWAAVSNADSYDVDYKLTSSADWTSAATATTATTADISGLTESTVYDWRVRTNCAAGSSNYTAAQFTTATPAAICDAPIALTSSAITTSSATVSWTASGTAVSYAVDYKLVSSATWISAATATTATSVSLSGLIASSVYDWRVISNCSSGTSSYVAAQFTTADAPVCDAPIALTSSAITTSSATVSWTASGTAVSYAVDYKLASSATWISTATATTASSISLSGLTASSVYDWRVLSNCSSGTSSYVTAQFTTADVPVCNAPTALTASAITSTGATVSWTASGTAVSYAVDYKLASSATWISAATATTGISISLSGLTASSVYDWRVRSNCSSGTSSYVSAQFTTATPTGCQSSYDVSTNGTTAGAASIPFNTNITGLISPSGDIDNYKFVITKKGTITATLTTLPADYDLKILNSAGTQVAISQKGGTTSESINYTAAAGTYYAQVFGYNGANSATTCYTLKVATGTAAKNDGSAADVASGTLLKVYPNPAVSSINISLLGDVSGKNILQITDARGGVVIEKQMTNSIQSVDVTRLAKGVYIIKVLNGSTVLTTKFVKQ